MKNQLGLQILYELAWFSVAGILALLFVLPIQPYISKALSNYLLISLFLGFTYFRYILFIFRSIIFKSIWIKIGVLILNVALFFLVINQYFSFSTVADDYIYTLPQQTFQHIHSGTDLDKLLYIKNIVAFSGFFAVVCIFLLEIRLVYAIFKLRQLDKVLYPNQQSSI